MTSGKMHSLLKRQLKSFFGDSFEAPDEWRGFIDMVNNAYHESDMDRNMLERSLELSSQELLQANSEMRAIFEAVPDIFFRIDQAGTILDCKTGHISDLPVSRRDILGGKIYDIPLVPAADKFRKAIEDVKNTNTSASFEYYLPRHETEIFYEARFIPLLEDQVIIIIRNITDRKDAQSALRKSEEIYNRLVNAIPDLVGRTDLAGNIIFVNEYGLQSSGYSLDEIEGQNAIMLVAPQDRKRVLQNTARMMKQKIGPQEYRLIMKNGREGFFEVNSDILRNEDGTAFGIVHVCRDITERMRTEEIIRQNEKRFRLITDHIQDTVWLMDMNLRITWISPSVEQARGYSLDELRKLPLEKQFTPSSLATAISLVHQYLAPEKLENSREEISVKAELEFYRKDGSFFWADTVFTLLRNQQGVPAGILGISRDTTKRRQMEEALRQSERQYRLITEKMSDIVWIADMNLQTVYVTPSVQTILGFTQEERMRQSIEQQFPPDSLAYGLKALEREMEIEKQGNADPGRVAILELEYYHKDGSTRWMETTISGLRDDQGVLTGIHGVSRDITGQKRAQEELRDSESKLQAIFNQIDTGIMIIDAASQTIVDANNRAAEMIGSSREKMIGQICHTLVCPAERGRCPVKDLGQIIDQSERILLCAGGLQKDILKTVHPLAIKGRNCYLESFIDISDRKRMENELRESENKFRLLTERISDIVWTADMNLKEQYVSPSIQTVLGFTPEERMRQPLEQQLTPASLSHVYETLAKELAMELEMERQGLGDPRRSVTIELEYYHKQGSTRWMETVVTGIRNAQGVLTGLSGVSRDITLRKHVEKALRKSEARFDQMAKQSGTIVWEVNAQGLYTYVSEVSTKVLGYHPDELTGRMHFYDLHPENGREAFKTAVLEGFQRQEAFVNLENPALTKDGRPVWLSTNCLPVLDINGNLLGYRGSDTDITQRKQVEEALRQSEEKYRLIAENTGELITVTDLHLRFTYISPSIARTHGYTVEEAMQTPLDRFMTPASMEVLLEVFDKEMKLEASGAADPGRIRVLEVEEYKKDGSTVWLESSISALRNRQNEPVGILTVSRDITERRRTREALQRAHAELEQRVAERTYELTAANNNLKELFLKQEMNIDLAKNILSMINYRPNRHTLLPGDTGLFFTACYLPCYAEGGDHFFVKNLSEQYPAIHKTAVSLKDQSGHEVSCILRSIITDLIHNALLLHTPSLPVEETISRLNHEICELRFFGDDNFFTSVDAEINHDNLRMRYVSAGHPPFLLIREQEIVCLPSIDGQGRNLPVGIERSLDFRSEEIQLQQGDKLIFFTDGLTDMPHMSGKPVLSAQNVKDLILSIVQNEPHLPVSILMARLFNRINGREGDSVVIPRSFYDDITLMGLELEDAGHEYEDIVRPKNLEDLDACVNHLFYKISEEWESSGFPSPQTRLRMVLDEAMMNAWSHGNGKDPRKMIVVRRRYGNDAVLEVIDEGNGFDYKTFYDPTCRENLLKPVGRGIFIMRYWTEETQWTDDGRHLIAYFSREDSKKREMRSFSGFDLWRRFITD